MNVRPIRDRILVSPEIEEETTKSGIVLPDSAKEKSQKGKVIAVGSGKVKGGHVIPLEVKEGDTVIFEKYGPSEIKVNDEDFLIIKEEDILAVIDGEKEEK